MTVALKVVAVVLFLGAVAAGVAAILVAHAGHEAALELAAGVILLAAGLLADRLARLRPQHPTRR